MRFKIHSIKSIITLVLCLVAFIVQSQELPTFKYFDKNTVDEVEIDYDNDGDLDYIIAGVISEKNQGRVYLVENNGMKFNKPEYIYSFPTIPIKQQLDILQKGNITTINIIGTSPTGGQTKFVGTLIKGMFEGMLIAPATFKAPK